MYCIVKIFPVLSKNAALWELAIGLSLGGSKFGYHGYKVYRSL